jgi:uncharacterized protein YcbX
MPSAEVEARVTRLAVYPVKGLGGRLLKEVVIQDRGFAWDRRWMLVG